MCPLHINDHTSTTHQPHTDHTSTTHRPHTDHTPTTHDHTTTTLQPHNSHTTHTSTNKIENKENNVKASPPIPNVTHVNMNTIQFKTPQPTINVTLTKTAVKLSGLWSMASN